MDDQTLLRYSRQIMLPEIEVDGQRRLNESTVLIIGLGGLGSPVALYLAAAGVGRLVLVDFDAVDLSNLQRQIAHSTADIGRAKVDSAAESIHELNPLVTVTSIAEKLTDEALLDQIEQVDAVVDASDNLVTRLAVNGACVKAKKPLISGAAIRFEGQIIVYRPDVKHSPCYRCLYRSDSEVVETCTQSGVISPLLGIVGSLQAMEVIKVLCRIGESLTGRLLLIDALHMEVQTIKLKRNANCPVCGG